MNGPASPPRPEAGRLSWLLAVAREADPDPTGWRDWFRDPRVWRDHAAPKKLSDEADLARLSVPLVLSAAGSGAPRRGDLIDLLERAVRQHPDDLLINTYLALALEEVGHSSEAIRYYQAAVALRPEVPWVHQNIGVSLMSLGRFDEAIASYREAIRLDPEDRRPYPFLGYALAQTGRTDEAFAYFQKAMEMPCADPDFGGAPAPPRHPGGPRGRGPTRMAENPRRWPFALDAWDGYAELCLFLGELDEYRRARKVLLENVKPRAAPRRRMRRPGLPALAGLRGGGEAGVGAWISPSNRGGGREEWTYSYFLFARCWPTTGRAVSTRRQRF